MHGQGAEAHYRRLINTSPYAIFAVDAHGLFTELNPAGERLLRRTDLIGRPFADVIAPESQSEAQDVFDRMLAGCADEVELEVFIVRPDGERRLVALSATAIRESAIVGTHGIARDITDERRVQDERERMRRHYERLVTTSPYAIYALDLDGCFTEVNHATADVLGRTPEQLLGRPFSEVVAPEDLPRAVESFRSKLERRSATNDIEIRVVRADGERRLMQLRATPISDDGRIIGSQGIGRDITEEHARGARLQLLAAALDHLTEGVSVRDEDDHVIYSNASWARLLESGGTADPFELTADGAALRTAMRASLDQQGAWRGRIVPPADTGVPLEVTSGRVLVGDRTLTFMLLRDVSDEHDREQQLRRAERLASVATLVGGVAHELNNPLTSIAGFAELMLLDERPAEDLETLQLMRREATRAARIVADLRLLARETQAFDATERSAVDVNDVVAHVLRLQRYALDTSSIEVARELSPRLAPVLGSASALEQVVLNLVINARQALENTRGPRRLELRTSAVNDRVLVRVADTGHGIPPEHLERIFDPFFTTKPPGEGMGLGLSLVHRIVSEHGGEVRVDSVPGRGSAFTVLLPAVAPAAAGHESAAPQHTRALRILIVDDEGPIRLALQRYLARSGHTVDGAEDGTEALQRIRETTYDVIVSDLRMPHMGGEQLLNALAREHPGAVRRVILMTGHVGADHVRAAALQHDVPVVQKPFALDELRRLIEEHAARLHER